MPDDPVGLCVRIVRDIIRASQVIGGDTPDRCAADLMRRKFMGRFLMRSGQQLLGHVTRPVNDTDNLDWNGVGSVDD